MLGSGCMPGRIGFANVRSVAGPDAFPWPGSATKPHPPHSVAMVMAAASIEHFAPGIVVHHQTAAIQAQDRPTGDRIVARGRVTLRFQSSRPRVMIWPIFSAESGARRPRIGWRFGGLGGAIPPRIGGTGLPAVCCGPGSTCTPITEFLGSK